MRTLITGIIFLLAAQSSFCQIELLERKEFDLRDDENIVLTYVIGKKGLFTLGIEEIKGGNDNYIFTKYDTDLDKSFSESFEKESRIQRVGFFPNEDTSVLYCLFENKREWIIKQIDVMNGGLTESRFEKADPYFVRNGSLPNCVDGKLFLKGLRKKKPHLMILELKSGFQNIQEIEGINTKRSIESFAFDTNLDRLIVFLRDGKDLKKAVMYLQILDLNGKVLSNIQLEKESEFSIIDGRITWIDDDSFILAGTYGLGAKSTVASGYYFSKWNGAVQEFITYHSFTEFENFFSYLPERTQKRLEKKKQRKSDRGLTDFIKTRVAIHPVIVNGSVYRLIGEVYYPTYRTETYSSMGPNGTMTTSTRQVFDGYQYSHAAILDIDEEGNKIKDYCFKMFLMDKPWSVVLKLRVKQEADGNMHFIFTDMGSIRAASITADGEITQTDFGRAETGVEGDKVWTSSTSSYYWFDNVYVMVGWQRIKNKENMDVNKKRNVFFINKISYSSSWE
ncbi:MAG: hypothetical protein ACOVO3_05100 [Fluviicola sp.]